jgi:hypothetical protein
MKTYRVHLTEMTCGDVIVEALNRDDAEDKALHSAAVDWDSEAEVEVTNIVELDASGNEK